MRRRFVKWILATGVLCAAVAFVSKREKKPEDVVEEYLKYTFLDNNGEKAYALLSSDDRTYISEKDFVREVKKNNVLNKNVLEKYEDFFYYEILDSRRSNDTVYVEVALTKPNALNVLREMVGYAMFTSFSTLTEEQQNQAIENKFKSIMMSKDRLTVTTEKTFVLVPEEKGYRIYLNLGKPRKMEKLQAKLSSLEFRAEEQFRLIDLEGALETYRHMASLAPHPGIRKNLREIEEIVESTVREGETLVRGNLKFIPSAVRLESISLAGRPAGDYLTMRFSVKNVSEGEVFAILDNLERINMISHVRDNFGNIIRGVSIIPYGNTDSSFTIAPGESKNFMAVCEKPLSGAASGFLWEMRFITNNRREILPFLVRFERKDVYKQEMVERMEIASAF